MSDQYQRGVYLIIASPGMKKTPLFFVMPEGFEDVYSTNFQPKGGERQSHPKNLIWKGGKIEDWTVQLELVAGVSYKLETSEQLVGCVETLYSMALPERPGGLPGLVIVTCKGSDRFWFQRKAFITNIRVKWESPMCIKTGGPLRANVSVTFVPFYGKALSRPAQQGMIPRRPYHFMKG